MVKFVAPSERALPTFSEKPGRERELPYSPREAALTGKAGRCVREVAHLQRGPRVRGQSRVGRSRLASVGPD